MWSDVEEWQAREDRWDAVSADSLGVEDTPEFLAAELVLDSLASEDVFSQNYRHLAGVLCVANVTRAANLLGTEPASFLADDRSFIDDDGTCVIPWNTTLRMARDAAAHHADTILQTVAKQERRATRNAISGDVVGTRRRPWYISPEVCMEVDSRYAPAYALLRE
jgi:hypothetical protein